MVGGRRERFQGKGKGKWRQANKRHQMQTAIHPGQTPPLWVEASEMAEEGVGEGNWNQPHVTATVSVRTSKALRRFPLGKGPPNVAVIAMWSGMEPA